MEERFAYFTVFQGVCFLLTIVLSDMRHIKMKLEDIWSWGGEDIHNMKQAGAKVPVGVLQVL